MKITVDPRIDAITEKIIGAAFAVSNTLGHGFLENVYKNALAEELRYQGVHAVKEKTFRVYYRDQEVGVYIADLVVEDTVIVELKAIETLLPGHVAQVLNYLKAGGLPVGLLLNFGRPKLEIRRVLR